MANINFLRALLNAYSPSGYETLNENNNSIKVFNDELSKNESLKHEFVDAVGNSCFSVGAQTPKVRFMISGHIDEIGGQIQYIDDDGFLHFIKDGGLDPKAILGSRVTIIKESGIVRGVIGKKAIHVEHRDQETDKVTKLSEMKIDIGASSKKEAEDFVSVGDPFVVDGEFFNIGASRFTSRGLDDKVGVYVTAEVLKALSEVKLNNIRVYGVACTQEEVGAQGAVNAVKGINPDYSIDYDVTFATDDGFVKKDAWGDVQLGKGAALAHGVDCNHDFCKLIKTASRECDIPFQEFCVGSGGTDTVHIKRNSYNAKTALISLPNRNMHTQSEVCDYRDLQSAIDMTVATIMKLDAELA